HFANPVGGRTLLAESWPKEERVQRMETPNLPCGDELGFLAHNGRAEVVGHNKEGTPGQPTVCSKIC
ncbi:MAG: hypothetical protein ACKPKO_17205, partial [Candidatus Fonsibacter sp.]